MQRRYGARATWCSIDFPGTELKNSHAQQPAPAADMNESRGMDAS